MIYVRDLAGRFLMVNAAYERTMGVKESELLGRTADVLDPELAVQWRRKDLRSQQGPHQLEEVFDTPEGTRYFDTTAFPVFDAQGKLYATCGISLEVTEHRRAMAELAEARDSALAANAELAEARDTALATNAELAEARDSALGLADAKSTFLATMSHEIRTPMNAVIGMTDLLLDTPLNEQQRGFLGTVRTSGDALLAVINDILDFSRMESGEIGLASGDFNLRNQVEGSLDLVSSVATGKGLDLVTYVDDDCPVLVTGDANRLRQILVNLLSNALKFTDEGEVLVTVSSAPADDGGVRLRIDVTDTGIGISPDGVLRLFKSFSQIDASNTRLYGGSGLGLVISQRLAQAMGGDVTVASVEDRGSTFTAELLLGVPERQQQVDGGTAEDNEGRPDLSGLRALIVDDNATSLRILDLQLRGLGLTTSAVSTPTAALAAAASQQAGSQTRSFDVAVLDLMMPEMDGLDLATALAAVAASADTPVVLLASIGAVSRPMPNSIVVTVPKPVKSSVLTGALLSALRPQAAPAKPLPAEGEPGGPGGQLQQVGDAGRTDQDRGSGASSERPLRVLLAEDNLVNQRVAQLMLQKLGHRVDTVANGREAVAALEQATYDCVLMDVQMPVLDGLAATREIRGLLPPTQQPYIIAMTAGAMAEDREACTAAGMNEYLAKPVRVQALQDQLAIAAETARRTAGPSVDQLPRQPLERVAAPEESSVALGSGAPVPVDLFVLDRLRKQLEDADGAELSALINTYILDGAVSVTELAAAVAAADWPHVSSIAHAWAARSEVIGATALGALLARAEQASQDAPATVAEMAAEISTEHARVSASLKQLGTSP
jgi:PAS domain S-box-containing protein